MKKKIVILALLIFWINACVTINTAEDDSESKTNLNSEQSSEQNSEQNQETPDTLAILDSIIERDEICPEIKFIEPQCSNNQYLMPIRNETGCIENYECQEIKECYEIFAPVCASGTTYPNDCYAKADGHVEFYDGECEKDPVICPAICPGII